MGNICFITYFNYLHISITFAIIMAASQEYWEYTSKATLMKAKAIKTYSFIHSIGMCRMWRFLTVLRSFFHSCLLCTLSFYPFSPSSLSSFLTSFCHLFLGLPVSIVVTKFMYNTFLGILLSSILCTCSNQRILFNLIVSVIVGFFNHCINFFIG